MSDGPTNIDYVMATAAALGVPMTEWQVRAYLGRGDALKAGGNQMSRWGVESANGIVTVAPKGKVQAEKWAEYQYRPGTIGDIGERLVEIPAEVEMKRAA